MERTLIAWNLPNWITIVLMAAIGYVILGLALRVISNMRGSNPATADTVPQASTPMSEVIADA